MSDEEETLPTPLAIPSVVYSQIQPPSLMSTQSNLADNWKYFKKSWENFILVTRLDKKNKVVVMAALYSVLGKEVNQLRT